MKTFRAKLLFFFIPFFLLFSTAISSYFVVHLTAKVRANIIEKGIQVVETLSHACELGILTYDPMLLDWATGQVAGDEKVLLVTAYDKDGNILFTRNKAGIDDGFTNGDGPPETRHQVINHNGNEHFDFTAPVFRMNMWGADLDKAHIANEVIGYIRLVISTRELDEEFRTTLIRSALIELLFFILGIGISIYFARRISHPVSVLSQSVEALGKGKFQRITGIRTGDEIGRLADAFNRMAEELRDHQTNLEDKILERTRELAEREELLRVFVRNTPSSFAMVDRDMRYLVYSRRWLKVLGREGNDLVGRKHYDLFPGIPERWKQEHRECLAGSVIHSREEQFEAVNGSMEWIRRAIHPWKDGSGRIGGLIIFADIITREKKMQERMVQSEKMMSVGGLAAGMAHEINNPLAGILQSSQVALNRLTREMPANSRAADDIGIALADIRQYMEKRQIPALLDSVREAGKRAARIVDNMLSFSRQQESRAQACSLAELMDKTVELAENDYDLKKNFDFRSIRINRSYSEGVGPVQCEGSKIQQVFFNILKNGAEAMAGKDYPPGDSPEFDLAIQEERGMACVRIRDNGPGMEEPTRKRIFEPFFTSKGTRGTGLGLSVSYFIVTDNHKGVMEVESEPDRGSTFIIRLPLERDSGIPRG